MCACSMWACRSFHLARLSESSKLVHLETVKKLQKMRKKPAKQLPNLITISGGRREKSFRYNSEGLKNGKLIFLFFLQLKRAICFQLGYSRLIHLCYSWILSKKKLNLQCFLLKSVVLTFYSWRSEKGREKVLGQRIKWNISIADRRSQAHAVHAKLLKYKIIFSNRTQKTVPFFFSMKRITKKIWLSWTMIWKVGELKKSGLKKLRFHITVNWKVRKNDLKNVLGTFLARSACIQGARTLCNKTINRSEKEENFLLLQFERFVGEVKKCKVIWRRKTSEIYRASCTGFLSMRWKLNWKLFICTHENDGVS